MTTNNHYRIDPVGFQKLKAALEAIGNPELVPCQSWIAQTAREALEYLNILSTKNWSISDD